MPPVMSLGTAVAPPENVTSVEPWRPVPSISSVSPGCAVAEPRPVMVGTTKFVADVRVDGDPDRVTVIFPVVAPAGTVTVIWSGLLNMTEVAGVPLNATAASGVKPNPERMMSAVPGTPPAGLNDVNEALGLKLAPDGAESTETPPADVWTVIG